MKTSTIPVRKVHRSGALAIGTLLMLSACTREVIYGRGSGGGGGSTPTTSLSTGNGGASSSSGFQCFGGAVLIFPQLDSVTPEPDGVALAWTTHHACDSEIDRSDDGGPYQQIAVVPAEMSCEGASYTYLDATASETGVDHCHVVRCWGGGSNELCSSP